MVELPVDFDSDSLKIHKILTESEVNFHDAQWGPDSQLYVISDSTDWWNVYKVIFQLNLTF